MDQDEQLRQQHYFYRVTVKGGGEFVFKLARDLNEGNLLTVALEHAVGDCRERGNAPADITDISKATYEDYLAGR